MKRLMIKCLIIANTAVFLFGCAAYGNNTKSNLPNTYVGILDVAEYGSSPIVGNNLNVVLKSSEITMADDKNLLLHMLDEKKLASDVITRAYTS